MLKRLVVGAILIGMVSVAATPSFGSDRRNGCGYVFGVGLVAAGITAIFFPPALAVVIPSVSVKTALCR